MSRELSEIEEKIVYYPSGQLRGRSLYKNGLLHGVSEFFSEEGVLVSSSYFIEGKPYGETRQFYGSGALSAILRYEEGKQEGKQEYFYPDGIVKTLLFYKAGKLHGVCELFWPSSRHKRVCSFSHGVKTGWDRIISPTGVILDEGEFVEGNPIGLHRRRHLNGHLKEEKFYYQTLGKIDRRTWNNEGQIEYEGLFIEGNLFQESRFSWPEGKKETRVGVWDGHGLRF